MGPRQGFLIFFTFFHGLYIYYLFLKKNLWDNQLFSLRFCPIKFSFNNISYLDRNVLFPMTNANAMSSQNHVGIMQVGPNKETLPLDSDFLDSDFWVHDFDHFVTTSITQILLTFRKNFWVLAIVGTHVTKFVWRLNQNKPSCLSCEASKLIGGAIMPPPLCKVGLKYFVVVSPSFWSSLSYWLMTYDCAVE